MSSALVAFLASGCGYESPGPPARFQTTVVEGAILFDGQPVRAGWVTVLPIGPTLGDLAIARIGGDGKFRIDDAPIGPLAVRITLPKSTVVELQRASKNLVQRLQLVSGAASPLRIQSLTGRPTRFEFDLLRSPIGEGP